MELKTRLAVCFSICAATLFAQPTCPADSLELVNFYNNMNGPNWFQKWDLQKPMKTWNGIALNGSGCVEKLLLGEKLRGTLPDIDLPSLKLLGLAATWAVDSTFVTAIPDFSKMPILEEMHLSNIAAAPPGTSFPDFSHLPLLKSLRLSGNRFTGSLTDFSHLPELEYIQFSNSLATGPVPDFQYLPNLQSLTIIESAVTAVPDFQNFPLLETLRVIGTSLAGPIPDFQHLPNLKDLVLGGTKVLGDVFPADFDGPIPDFSALPKLEKLDLDYLSTSSEIPDFSKMPLLKSLSIIGTELTGQMPDFHFLPNLEFIEIRGWREWFLFIPEQPRPSKITGPLPDFSNCPNFKGMDFSLNRLSGNVPDFSNLPNIAWIELSQNLFSGTIPAFASLPPSAQSIRLTANDLTGFAPLATSAKLTVDHNLLTFEDLLPEFGQLDEYAQQDSVTVQPLYFENGGGKMELDLVFDENVAGSTYKWYKNGTLTATTADNNLELLMPAKPADRFRVAVTNPGAPDLLLVTKTFAVGGQPPVASFETDQTPGCSITNFPAFMKFAGPADPAGLISIKWTFPGGNPATSIFANPLVQYAAPGTYSATLIVENLFGSDTFSLDFEVIFVAAPNANFTFVQNGLSITCNAADATGNLYSWNFGDGNFDNTSGQTVQHTYAAPGNYAVQLFFSNSCSGAFLTQTVGVTGASEPTRAIQVQVFPNPTDGAFLVEIFTDDFDGELVGANLFNPAGQLFLEKKGQLKNGQIRFDFEKNGLPAGIYFLEIRGKLGVATRRVFVY